MRMTLVASTILLMFASVASAHPGPHEGLKGLVHLLTEPDHVAVMLIVAGCSVALVMAGMRVRSRRRDSDESTLK